MSSDGKFDYQREAAAAMKMAVATSGVERLKWVQVAQVWQDLGRWVEERDSVASTTCAVRARRD